MAGCQPNTTVLNEVLPWIAPPAESLWQRHGFRSDTFRACATSANPATNERAPLLLARKCPVPGCGRTMEERILTDKDGKIVGTQYRCPVHN